MKIDERLDERSVGAQRVLREAVMGCYEINSDWFTSSFLFHCVMWNTSFCSCAQSGSTNQAWFDSVLVQVFDEAERDIAAEMKTWEKQELKTIKRSIKAPVSNYKMEINGFSVWPAVTLPAAPAENIYSTKSMSSFDRSALPYFENAQWNVRLETVVKCFYW